MGRTFSRESTTDEVLADIDLSGKTMLVTGANSGLGTETARALAAAGARVVITTRSTEKSEAALMTLREAVPEAVFESVEMDLGSLASVRRAAEEVVKRFPVLDALIGNAGVMNTPFGRTEDGFETQFGVDHLGHFVFCARTAAAVLAAAPARVVLLSSGAHFQSDVLWDDINWERTEYDKILAYGQAKTANMLCATELNSRLAPRGVEAFSVHPGVIMTNLGRYMSEEDRAEMITRIKERMSGRRTPSSGDVADLPLKVKSIQQGAATTCWAATAPELAGCGGGYLADCNIAPIVSAYDPAGCMAYGLDRGAAEKLWKISEEMVGEQFDL